MQGAANTEGNNVQALQELVGLAEVEKAALGISATAQEIAQQPKTWRGTREVFMVQAERLRSFLEAAGVTGPAEERPCVVLTGAGTSDYIGQVLTLLLRREWRCEVQAIASTDLLMNLSDYLVPGRRYLVISFSRSGDSPEGVTGLSQMLAKYPDLSHLVVSCNAHGRMAEIARGRKNAYALVLDDVVNDRGLAMTSSFSNMVVLGQCLAHAWSTEAYDGIFDALVEAGEAFLLTAGAAVRELVEKRYERVCVLGSGALTGVARESALKVGEMTAGRVSTMSDSVLGLRHGPMAALDRHTLLICFASGDARRQRYEVDLLREIASKDVVAQRVVIGPAEAKALADCSERYLAIQPGVPDLYRPPVDVIFGQLLGLYSSMALGLKPDAPSPGGVITRVVGEFNLYETVA